MKEVIKKIMPEFLKRKYRSYREKCRLESYAGDEVLCPICNSRFNMFAPFGSKLLMRQNAMCHTCRSLERHRLTWKYLIEKTNFFSSDDILRVLHIAPESAFYNEFSKNPKIDYVPCDLFPEKYDSYGMGKIRKEDVTKLSFYDNSFDVVICFHVFEHIPDDRTAISEIYRVMKKGGWAILQVPIDYSREKTYEDFSITNQEEREIAFGEIDHVRWYGRDYKSRLAAAGFKVTEDDYVRTFHPKDIFKYGFVASELIYYCEKE